MNEEQLDQLMDEARDEWAAKTGNSYVDNFDAHEALCLYSGFTPEDLVALGDYIKKFVMHMVAHKVIDSMTGRGEGDGLDMNDIIEMAIGASIPVVIVASTHQSRSLARVSPKHTDRYTTTVMAEAYLNTLITEGEDLSTIWPTAIASEVIDQYDPQQAFMVGVLCGRTDG